MDSPVTVPEKRRFFSLRLRLRLRLKKKKGAVVAGRACRFAPSNLFPPRV